MGMPKVSTTEEALVWNQAAKFLIYRLQASQGECPGREPDMSLAAATAMRKILAQIEAGFKLMSNREKVVNDIINPAPKSQPELKRLDSKHKNTVDAMVSEVISRLLCFGVSSGKGSTIPGEGEQALVWAEAARFLNARIQTPDDWQDCEYAGFPNRKSDMSNDAARALRATLGQVEAAVSLMSNHENVVKDITNPGSQAILGGNVTQLDLKRVDPKHRASVDNMVRALAKRLLGDEVSAPSNADEAMAWVQAAAFFSKRIQSSSADCSGRKADMSSTAAREMRAVLAQFEAGSKLKSNFETVKKDITNPGPLAIGGGKLTQLNLMRVDSARQAAAESVDAMLRELCNRLFGNKKSEPSMAEARVWSEAATFLNGRIQGLSDECPGREADMSFAAATAMRVVLAQIPNQTKTSSATAKVLHSAHWTNVGGSAQVSQNP